MCVQCMYACVFVLFVADWMSDLRLSSGQIVLKAISVTGMPTIPGRHCYFQFTKADAYITVYLFKEFSDI